VDKNVGQHFQRLIASGQPVGEIIAIDSFLVEVKGLQPVTLNALVVFEDGSGGYVHEILPDRVVVLHMGVTNLRIGMALVLTGASLAAKVGKDYIGRVVSVTGEPLDGKGAIASDGSWPVFNRAPAIHERQLLEDQLETGVIMIDTLFPIVRGQRMAMLGDSKSGKSTLATQIAINQRDTDQVVVYVLIAKRRSDVDTLLTRLSDNDAMSKAIVVVSTIFESLVMSYLAPYVGCAMAEYLWQKVGQDVVIIYDDLTAHAHAHREISLLSKVSPGRDSYPGDMFHAHSSLLERAGRLAANHHCLTAIPMVLADGGDITAYLPTNIMSITDGQWILDMAVFRSGVRPAMSSGLSVTRVGGVGQNHRQQDQGSRSLKALAAFRVAEEFSRFGSELAPASKKDLERGHYMQTIFTQKPGQTYSLMAQQLLVGLLLDEDPTQHLDIARMQDIANQTAKLVKDDKDFDGVMAQFRAQVMAAVPGSPAPPAAQPVAQTPTAAPAATSPPAAPPTQPVAAAPAAVPTGEPPQVQEPVKK
jgi:F-type H+-transporting ATPase subunit alpha